MENKALIGQLEDELLTRIKHIEFEQNEANCLKNAIIELKKSNIYPETSQITQIRSPENYPNYPDSASLFEKYQYLEDIEGRIWPKKYMDGLIADIEGEDKAKETLKSSSTKLNQYVLRKKAICAKYNDSNKCCFYTTRRSWIIEEQDGEKKIYKMSPGKEPDMKFLSRIPEEKKQADKIKFYGI